MKVIIAGSRTIKDWKLVEDAWGRSDFNITELVSGAANGVDKLGMWLCKRRGIPIKYFFPEWDHFGRSAGVIRNREMAEYADALIAVWDGFSKGTQHIIHHMNKLGKPTFVSNLNTGEYLKRGGENGKK